MRFGLLPTGLHTLANVNLTLASVNPTLASANQTPESVNRTPGNVNRTQDHAKLDSREHGERSGERKLHSALRNVTLPRVDERIQLGTEWSLWWTRAFGEREPGSVVTTAIWPAPACPCAGPRSQFMSIR